MMAFKVPLPALITFICLLFFVQTVKVHRGHSICQWQLSLYSLSFSSTVISRGMASARGPFLLKPLHKEKVACLHTVHTRQNSDSVTAVLLQW